MTVSSAAALAAAAAPVAATTTTRSSTTAATRSSTHAYSLAHPLPARANADLNEIRAWTEQHQSALPARLRAEVLTRSAAVLRLLPRIAADRAELARELLALKKLLKPRRLWDRWLRLRAMTRLGISRATAHRIIAEAVERRALAQTAVVAAGVVPGRRMPTPAEAEARKGGGGRLAAAATAAATARAEARREAMLPPLSSLRALPPKKPVVSVAAHPAHPDHPAHPAHPSHPSNHASAQEEEAAVIATAAAALSPSAPLAPLTPSDLAAQTFLYWAALLPRCPAPARMQALRLLVGVALGGLGVREGGKVTFAAVGVPREWRQGAATGESKGRKAG